MTTTPAFDARAYGRKNMLARHGMTDADLGPKKTDAQLQADELAALPKSIEEAGGDARAYMKADMMRRAAARNGVKASSPARESMAKILRARGVEPLS